MKKLAFIFLFLLSNLSLAKDIDLSLLDTEKVFKTTLENYSSSYEKKERVISEIKQLWGDEAENLRFLFDMVYEEIKSCQIGDLTEEFIINFKRIGADEEEIQLLKNSFTPQVCQKIESEIGTKQTTLATILKKYAAYIIKMKK